MNDEPNFVSRTDTRPEFFNFISGLRADDLIAELIQNEIDAGSTHTTIAFGRDKLLCTGNGRPVDGDGWLRLSYLRYATEFGMTPSARTRIKSEGGRDTNGMAARYFG